VSKLTTWVNENLEQRDWSYNLLARKAGLSSGGVSRVMTERRKPGLDFCVGVARAFGERPEYVLRLAGLLPPVPPSVAEEDEILALIRSLPPLKREAALDMLRGLAKHPIPLTSPEAVGNIPAHTADDATGDKSDPDIEHMFQMEEATRDQADSLLMAAHALGRLDEIVDYISQRSQNFIQRKRELTPDHPISAGDGPDCETTQ